MGALKQPEGDMADLCGRANGGYATRRVARREAIAAIAGAALLLGAIGWLALRGTEWTPRAVLRGEGDAWPLGFLPDGKGFATAGAVGVTVWDTATGQLRSFWAQADGSRAGMAAFSPDGSVLATIDFFGPGSPMAIKLRDVSDGRPRWTLPTPNEGAYAILFKPADKQVRAVLGVSNADAVEIVDVDVASGREITRRRATMVNRLGSAVSPDGRLMAFLSGTAVVLWNLETDREFAAPVVSSTGTTASAAGFSPDGSILAVGLSNGSIQIWDVPALKHRATVTCHSVGVHSVGLLLSADGTLVASRGQFSAAYSLVGAFLDSLARAIGAGAAARQEVVVVDVATGRQIGAVQAAIHPFFSSDGRTLAVRDSSFAVQLFDVPVREAEKPSRDKAPKSPSQIPKK
jgi:WD40 repeat protein